MILIRTAEAMAHVIASSPDPELRRLLATHAERLVDYPLEEVAKFVIVQPGNTLDAIEAACDFRLVAKGEFLTSPELIVEHTHHFEVTWVLSDDGFGLVVLVSKAEGTDSELLAACHSALFDYQPHNAGHPEP